MSFHFRKTLSGVGLVIAHLVNEQRPFVVHPHAIHALIVTQRTITNITDSCFSRLLGEESA